MYQEAQQKIKLGWETYFYVMKHTRSKFLNPASIANGEQRMNLHLFLGTLHGDELPFLMDFYGLADVPLRPIDEEFKEVLLSTFISFIKTGYFNPFCLNNKLSLEIRRQQQLPGNRQLKARRTYI